MSVAIRRIEPRDEQRWLELWEGYCRFYERTLSEPKTWRTWGLIMNAAAPVHAIVAEQAGDRVTGIANYIIHENTWELTPVCYLQDLFVDPAERAVGVGKQLIDWLVAECRAQGWSRLYWNTKENNYRARGLYDKYGVHSGFLSYRVEVPLEKK